MVLAKTKRFDERHIKLNAHPELNEFNNQTTRNIFKLVFFFFVHLDSFEYFSIGLVNIAGIAISQNGYKKYVAEAIH